MLNEIIETKTTSRGTFTLGIAQDGNYAILHEENGKQPWVLGFGGAKLAVQERTARASFEITTDEDDDD